MLLGSSKAYPLDNLSQTGSVTGKVSAADLISTGINELAHGFNRKLSHMLFNPGVLYRCSLAKPVLSKSKGTPLLFLTGRAPLLIGRFLSSAASILRKGGHRFARFCFTPLVDCIC